MQHGHEMKTSFVDHFGQTTSFDLNSVDHNLKNTEKFIDSLEKPKEQKEIKRVNLQKIIDSDDKKAKELGIPRDKWVYLHGCADGNDHWYLSERINFHSSPAMNVTSKEALKMSNCKINESNCNPSRKVGLFCAGWKNPT